MFTETNIYQYIGEVLSKNCNADDADNVKIVSIKDCLITYSFNSEVYSRNLTMDVANFVDAVNSDKYLPINIDFSLGEIG